MHPLSPAVQSHIEKVVAGGSAGRDSIARADSQRLPRRSQSWPPWVADLKRFEVPSRRKATLQLLNTLMPYLALLTTMYLTIYWKIPYWVTLLIAIPTAGFLVRLFIFFHDCAHGSYLASSRAMVILGNILGGITFTPFEEWRHAHSIHHAGAGNLDRRGMGDVWTMTVQEYLASRLSKRLAYRLFRHPLVLFGFGPIYTFLIVHRFPMRGAKRIQIRSVILTDLMIATILVVAALTIGIKAYLMIMLPTLMIGGAAGIWLFYVQHQFDPSYWARSGEWDLLEAALRGSSFYKLPRILQWFSGNIGFHHAHHLRPLIPNYNLERCIQETRELQLENPLTFWRSLKSVRLNLWDEEHRILLGFGDIGARPGK